MKSLKFIILVLSFAAVSAAVSGCSLKFWQKPEAVPVTGNSAPAEQQQNNELQLQGEVVATSTESVDTSDWLTYRNEEYGFEVKYPLDWRVQGMLLQNQTDKNQEIFITVSEYNQQRLDIYSWIKTQKWPSPEPIDNQFNSFNQIYGIEAFEQQQTGTVYFIHNKNIFIIENGVSMERRVVDKKLFNQILSTFKFLN